ncbi:MAG: pantoate--beta-alanine ligase [Planctomycetes bacterium]|nr:pantoate--beta-alanine ligase [Planctomycetota bacterium]
MSLGTLFPSLSLALYVSLCVAESVDEVRAAVRRARQAGKIVGFVPTMGALHVGHVSLMQRARAECDLVVTSIFVNPTQFGPSEDFTRYPRPRETDLQICGESGVDVVFYPTVETMYPAGHRTYVEVGGLSEILEGAIRPGHFRGVATVVTKLFNIVQADRAYFGQKDYQQQTLIRVMTRELDLPTEVITCETIRDPDGLALSSRNAYLSPAERQSGLSLSRALRTADALVAGGERDVKRLEAAMRRELESTPGVKIDYAVIVHHESLAELTAAEPTMVALVAATVGSTRLIDNWILRLPRKS